MTLLTMAISPAFGQGLDSLVSPGELSRPHSKLSGLENCTRCHAPGKGIDQKRCLTCHQDLAERIAAGRGFHGNLKARCASCHPDHQGANFQIVSWNRDSFNHALTGSPLEGLHRGVPRCQQCHNPKTALRGKDGSFLIAKANCASCHEDVHRGRLKGDCGRCHSVAVRFKSAAFDHSQAAFRLEGAHQRVSCRSCHGENLREAVAFRRCTDCHRDRHEPTLGTECRRCHSLWSWKVDNGLAPFDHSRTKFPLIGGHARVPCDKCHSGRRFRGLEFDRCQSCHADQHQGQFSKDCAACHSLDSFRTTTFDHAASQYPLTGRHQSVLCEKCHPRLEIQSEGRAAFSVRYNPLPTQCLGCHADIHQGQLSTHCESCHDTTGFERKFVRFDHDKDSRYPLTGKHRAVACQRCHRNEPAAVGTPASLVRFRPIGTDCRACHLDYHDGQLEGSCGRCHDTAGFRPVTTFDHSVTQFPLLGKHAQAACSACHPMVEPSRPLANHLLTPLFRPLTRNCAACHANPHRKDPLVDCGRCHGLDGFGVREFNHQADASFPLTGRHRGLKCVQCHAEVKRPGGTTLSFVRHENGCAACHRSPHASHSVGCAKCHTTRTWKVLDW